LLESGVEVNVIPGWLGQADLATTNRCAREDHPEHPQQGLHEAGYFARNVRTIEVLLDRNAVASGGTAAGEPWQ
jgi:hypothetical protein